MMLSRLITLDTGTPLVPPSAWVAPGATLAGGVQLEEEASVWYGAVLRADGDRIVIGARSNVQDGAVVHADPGFPVVVGPRVTIGHRAVLHGCTVEAEVLVGMGAILLNGARIGRGSVVAAGALVLEGVDIPEGSLVVGVPARVRRPTTDEERRAILAAATSYTDLMVRHADATRQR